MEKNRKKRRKKAVVKGRTHLVYFESPEEKTLIQAHAHRSADRKLSPFLRNRALDAIRASQEETQ